MADRVLVLLALVPLATVIAPPEVARADDAPAPVLALDSDADLPVWSIAVTVDPLAAWLGAYGTRFDVALAPAHSLTLLAAWTTSPAADAIGIEAGYRVWPLGEGLSGPFAGPSIGVAVDGRVDPAVAIEASLDAGAQLVWEGLVLGASGGAGVRATFDDGQRVRDELVWRVGLAIGWAWM